MPIIEVHLAEGRSQQTKAQLCKSVTDAVVASVGVRPEQVRIIIREIPDGHFAVAGEVKHDVFGTGSSNAAPD